MRASDFLGEDWMKKMMEFPSKKIVSSLLLEYDANKVNAMAAKLKERLSTNQDPSALKDAKEPEDFAKAIEQMGVTSGEILFWLLNRYANNGIKRWEDIESKAIPALTKFEVLKKKPNINPPLPTKDINKINTLDDLENIVENYPAEKLLSKKEKSKIEDQEFYDKGRATLLYNDSTIKVVVPHTEEASKHFGKGPPWCTAAENNNKFSEYNEKGPLYIVMIKGLNQKYQFYWHNKSNSRNEFMDKENDPINPNDLAKKYPVLWRIFGPIAEKHNSLQLNPNPSEKVQLAAVKKDGVAIQFIENPSEKVQLAAVKKNGFAIKYIKNPSEEIQLAAVNVFGYAIKDIKNPSEEVQLAAVNKDGFAINYIKNPSEKVQLAAVNKDADAIDYIKNPSEEAQLAVVNYDGSAIRYIENPSEEVQLAAVNNKGYAIEYIKNPTPKVIELAKSKGYTEQ